MADKEKELQAKVMEMNYLRSRAGEFQQQLLSIQQLLEENSSTIIALDNLEGMKKETLFQLGSGVYARGKATDSASVLVDLGARVIAEKSVGDAKKLLGERRNDLDKALQEMQQAYVAAARRMEELNAEAHELSHELGIEHKH